MIEETSRLDPYEWNAQDHKDEDVNYILQWRLEEEAQGHLRQADDEALDDFIVPDNEDSGEGEDGTDSDGSSMEII